MTEASATDVARAARLVAAISADDRTGAVSIIGEAKDAAELRGLAVRGQQTLLESVGRILVRVARTPGNVP